MATRTTTNKEKFKEHLRTPQTQSFSNKVKAGAYKFGAFMHWIFFKPTSEVQGEDPAQTSNAPVHNEDAGASATDATDGSMHGRTMAATRDLVEGGGPSEQQVAQHPAA